MDKNINDAGSADNTEKPCHPRFARLKRTLRRWEFWVGILSIILTLFLAVSVVAFWEQFQARPNLGYTGLFFVCLMGGATVIIPVPSIAVQFAMEQYLTLLWWV